MTYYAKGYGYHENGTKHPFSCVFDLDEVNAATFIKAIEKASNLSPYRSNKEIVFENIVVLSR